MVCKITKIKYKGKTAKASKKKRLEINAKLRLFKKRATPLKMVASKDKTRCGRIIFRAKVLPNMSRLFLVWMHENQ